MKNKQLTLVVVSLLVVVLSVSLAWFTTQIIGKGKDVNVTSANLQIVFTDTDGALSDNDIEPGWTATKKFTVENKSKETYKYNIVIKDLVNTFVTEGYLQYKITSTNNGYNMTEYKNIPKSSTATDTILASGISIPVGVTQTYTIEFKYPNDENVDQSEDMNKKLSGTLFITLSTEDIYAGYEEGTLGYQIMGDNIIRETRENFDTTFTDNTTGTLYKSTEKNVHNIADTTVYYYAGNTTNNWVKFGKYQNDLVAYRGYYNSTDTTDYKEYSTMSECTSASSYNVNCTEHKYANAGDYIYWRIIRTNADKSIRLLYSGVSPDTTEGHIKTTKFKEIYDDPMYVGYMYGTSGSLENNRTNENSSTIKTAIDNWYESNMTSYTKYLSTTAVYCNDRDLASGGTYDKSSSFYYAPRYRAFSLHTPTYDCTVASDAFSVDNTSAKLDYPIALMTSDEIMYAGGKMGGSLSSPYTWFYLNSSSDKIVNTHWWLMSPTQWDNAIKMAYVSIVNGYNGNLLPLNVESTGVIRPALSLKSCVKTSGGDGTASNPYTIQETTSGC